MGKKTEQLDRIEKLLAEVLDELRKQRLPYTITVKTESCEELGHDWEYIGNQYPWTTGFGGYYKCRRCGKIKNAYTVTWGTDTVTDKGNYTVWYNTQQ